MRGPQHPVPIRLASQCANNSRERLAAGLQAALFQPTDVAYNRDELPASTGQHSSSR